MRWDSTRPSNKDASSDVAKHMRSLQSDLDNWLQSIFYWGDSAGSAGYVRESLTTAALLTGRVHYAPPSQLSYLNRGHGEVMLDSENRRLVVITDTSSDDSVLPCA